MDHRYLKEADLRPKRRRDKDNPYTIYSVGIETDNPRYYVEFADSTGEHIRQEISKEIFEAYNKFELEDLSHLNEIDRHRAEGDAVADTDEDSTMETALKNLSIEQLQIAMTELSERQRRRLKLYFFEELTYQQIAEREGCTKQTVQESVADAKRKLKNLLKNFYNES